MLKRVCFLLPLGKCFNCAWLPIWKIIPVTVLYKISVSQGNVCKHAESTLKVSGMFFIIRGVCWLMNGKRLETPVMLLECELHWSKDSPSINFSYFIPNRPLPSRWILHSSKTLIKRSISMILWKNRGLWTVYIPYSWDSMSKFMEYSTDCQC